MMILRLNQAFCHEYIFLMIVEGFIKERNKSTVAGKHENKEI